MKIEKTREPVVALDADLSDSSFEDVNLQRARFCDVRLAGATFTDVDLSNVAIRDANVTGMTIEGEPLGSPTGVPRVTGLLAFVPARDLEVGKAFYTDLGFTVAWANADIAQLELGAFRFLLQKFYVAEHAENFMMSLAVADADAWWAHIEAKQIAAKYPGITCKPPTLQPWGLRVLYLSDPTGVLWHISDRKK